jgi:predicted metal-dependent enzyme (double-stranded beta helix superfamily)
LGFDPGKKSAKTDSFSITPKYFNSLKLRTADLTILPESLDELTAVLDRWSESLQQYRDTETRILFIANEMPGLLSNRPLFKKILADIAKGSSYPDLRQATMFSNEFILFINPQRLFSVRLFIYDSGQYTPVHDHNSWGVYGCVSNRIEVIRYRREDDGSKPGYARLQEIDRQFLRPGQTLSVLPLNEGIHQAGNSGQKTSIMLSVYGTPIRRLYVHQYDISQNTVSKRYPPRLSKKMLATRALDSMEWGKKVSNLV